MSNKMIADALYLFENRGEDAIPEINRLCDLQMYSDDADQRRIIGKFVNKVGRIYGRSPEEILIEKEEKEKVLHFLNWIKTLAISLGGDSWELWRDRVVYGESLKSLTKKYEGKESDISKRVKRIHGKIKKAIPYYNAEYGDILEYLKN